MPNKNRRFWFDVETTGLNYYENEIVSLAYMVEIDDEIKEKGIFYARPDNFDKIEPKALEVNGFTLEQLKTFPSQKELCDSVRKIFDNYSIRNHSFRFVTAGYNNAGCDVIFLQQLFIKHGTKSYEFFDYFFSVKIDLFTILPIIEELWDVQFKSHKLSDLSAAFKLQHQAHDAMSDIEVTYEIYRIVMNDFRKMKET